MKTFNKMMLIFPPGKVYLYPDGSPSTRKNCSPPIGIAYLAANLLKHGYDVSCLDMTLWYIRQLVIIDNNKFFRMTTLAYYRLNADL